VPLLQSAGGGDESHSTSNDKGSSSTLYETILTVCKTHLIREIATANLALMITPMINTFIELADEITAIVFESMTARASAAGRQRKQAVGIDVDPTRHIAISSNTRQKCGESIGLGSAERFLFLLGIAISSIFLLYLADAAKHSSAPYSHQSFALSLAREVGIILSSFTIAFFLSSSSVMLCLYRMSRTISGDAFSGTVVTSIISLIIASVFCVNIAIFTFNNGDARLVAQNASLALALAAAVVFLYGAFRWAKEVRILKLLPKNFLFGAYPSTGASPANDEEAKNKGAETVVAMTEKRNKSASFNDRVFVTGSLIVTIAVNFSVIIPISLILKLLGDQSSVAFDDLSNDYGDVVFGHIQQYLVAYYSLTMATALLLIGMEVKLQRLEISRGLVRLVVGDRNHHRRCSC
jgi:hypothetical protein